MHNNERHSGKHTLKYAQTDYSLLSATVPPALPALPPAEPADADAGPNAEAEAAEKAGTAFISRRSARRSALASWFCPLYSPSRTTTSSRDGMMMQYWPAISGSNEDQQSRSG